MTKPSIQLFEQRPSDFNPKIEVSALYVEIEGQILLLELSSKKPECGFLGVPAGKLELGETAEDAAVRELFEETGIHVEDRSQILPLGTVFMRKPHIDYTYHLFKVLLDKFPEIILSSEHQNYTWASPNQMNELKLMVGAREALEKYYLYKSVKVST